MDFGQQPGALRLRPPHADPAQPLLRERPADTPGEHPRTARRWRQRPVDRALLPFVPLHRPRQRRPSPPRRRPGNRGIPERQRGSRQFGPGRQRNDLRGQRPAGALPAEPQQRPYPDADPRPVAGIHARRPVRRSGGHRLDVHQRRRVPLRPADRFGPQTRLRQPQPFFALGQPRLRGLHRRLGRHLDRHERRRSELLRRLPAAVREVPRRRRTFAGRLPRAGLRGRRRGAHLDRHRKRGSASLRHGAPHAEPGRARPTPQHAVLDLLRTGRAVARNRQGALPARHPHAGRAGIRNARLCHGDA